MKLTGEHCRARYEALLEAAGHLRLTWTEDPLEYRQGLKMADWLEKRADGWLRRAREIEDGNV